MKSINYKTLVTLFFVFLTLCNCQNKPKDRNTYDTKTGKVNTRYIDFKNAEEVKEFKLSDIADSVEYIPLETSDKILVSSVMGIKTIDSLILIRDKATTYVFNLKGKFIKSLYAAGRGPGETFGTHISVDRKRKEIYVGSNYNLKLMNYTLSGKFLGYKKYMHMVAGFSYYLNDLIILPQSLSRAESCFYVYNIETDSLVYRYPFRYNHLPRSRGGYSMKYIWFDFFNNKVFFKEQVCDTIFCTKDFKDIKPAYILDFGNRRLKPEDYWNLKLTRFNYKEFIVAFKESYSFLIMKGVDDNKLHQYLYKKQSGKLIKSNDLKIVNDITGGPSLSLWEIRNPDANTNMLFLKLEPVELLESDIKPFKGSKLEEIMRNVTENDNPILVKAYLK